MRKRIYSYEYNGNFNEFPYQFATNKVYLADKINEWGEKFCKDNYIVIMQHYDMVQGTRIAFNEGSKFYFKNSQDAMMAKLVFK